MEILIGLLVFAISLQSIIICREMRSINDSLIDIADSLINLRKTIAYKKPNNRTKPQ